MYKKILISLMFASVITVTSSFAETTASPEELALIKNIGHDQLSVLNTFAGPGNLDGVVLQPAGGAQPIIMYLDKQGQYAMYGTLISKDGVNLTDKDTELYIKKYTALKISDNLAETTPIKEGRDDAMYKITVLADPNCSACHYAYDAMKPFIDKGELQVNWIMVYFVRPDSQAKAAAIMAAKDPGKAMAENEAGFNMKEEEGGIAPLKDIPEILKNELEGNMKFMHDTGIGSTPTIIYYDKEGQLKFLGGAPADFGAFLTKESPGAQTTKNVPSWWTALVKRVKNAV